MLTLFLILFWVLLSRSGYAPWDLPRYRQEGLWSSFCAVLVVFTIISVTITFMKWAEPILRWVVQYSDWLF